MNNRATPQPIIGSCPQAVSESGLRSEERLMKDNTSSVRAAAGRRGTACTKHGREAGEAAGSGGRGAVVSSAGDGAGWPAAASSPAGGSVGGEHWALLDRAGNLLVTHNQPLISSYNQQQHNNTIAFTDSWQCRAGAQWSQTSHAWHDSKDSGDTCCVRGRRRGQHEAGAGEQPDVRARYCHCHVSRVTCHVWPPPRSSWHISRNLHYTPIE